MESIADYKLWLRTIGYSPGMGYEEDAAFRQAVAAFQSDWGFSPTGAMDRDTAEALRIVYYDVKGKQGGGGRRFGGLMVAGGLLFGLAATGLVLWAASR